MLNLLRETNSCSSVSLNSRYGQVLCMDLREDEDSNRENGVWDSIYETFRSQFEESRWKNPYQLSSSQSLNCIEERESSVTII